jgi:hypothetical protein
LAELPAQGGLHQAIEVGSATGIIFSGLARVLALKSLLAAVVFALPHPQKGEGGGGDEGGGEHEQGHDFFIQHGKVLRKKGFGLYNALHYFGQV